MVILDAIQGQGERVYLDTNVFIYALEGYPDFVDELNELFESFDAGNLSAVTSELTLAEVLVRPSIDRNTERQTAYQQATRSRHTFLFRNTPASISATATVVAIFPTPPLRFIKEKSRLPTGLSTFSNTVTQCRR